MSEEFIIQVQTQLPQLQRKVAQQQAEMQDVDLLLAGYEPYCSNTQRAAVGRKTLAQQQQKRAALQKKLAPYEITGDTAFWEQQVTCALAGAGLTMRGQNKTILQVAPDRPKKRRSKKWLIVLALTVFVILSLLFKRRFWASPDVTAATPTMTSPPAATMIPTATTLPTPYQAHPAQLGLVVDGHEIWQAQIFLMEGEEYRGEDPSEIILPTYGGGVYPPAGPFGGTAPIHIAGHSQAKSGGENFAPLQEAAAGDRLVGCNDDQKCFSYRIVRAEAWTPAALASAFTIDTGALVVFTRGQDVSSFYVLTAELEKL